MDGHPGVPFSVSVLLLVYHNKKRNVRQQDLGAIVGGPVGLKKMEECQELKVFRLLPAGSRFTDDTVMTLAVAEWLMIDPTHSKSRLVDPCNVWRQVSRCWLWRDVSQIDSNRESKTI